MPTISGQVSGSIATVALNVPCKIISFLLVNRTIGNVILNVYIVDGQANDRLVTPLNLTQISGTIYTSDVPIIIPANHYMIIVSNGATDYYFSISDV